MTNTATTPANRSRGRTALPEAIVKEKVIRAASRLLLHKGYQATNIEAIAKEAGVAKKTVYRFTDNSHSLVSGIVEQWMLATSLDLHLPDVTELDLPAALCRILEHMAARLLCTEAVGMYRLLMQDIPNREHWLHLYSEQGIKRGKTLLTNWLQQHDHCDGLSLPDPEQAAHLLLSMALSEPLSRLSLALHPDLSSCDIRQHIRDTVQLWHSALLRQHTHTIQPGFSVP